MAEDVAVRPRSYEMLEDVPLGFVRAFLELRKLHEDICSKVALQTPVIEGLVLKAHKDEIASAQPAETHDKIPVERNDHERECTLKDFLVPHEWTGETAQHVRTGETAQLLAPAYSSEGSATTRQGTSPRSNISWKGLGRAVSFEDGGNYEIHKYDVDNPLSPNSIELSYNVFGPTMSTLSHSSSQMRPGFPRAASWGTEYKTLGRSLGRSNSSLKTVGSHAVMEETIAEEPSTDTEDPVPTLQGRVQQSGWAQFTGTLQSKRQTALAGQIGFACARDNVIARWKFLTERLLGEWRNSCLEVKPVWLAHTHSDWVSVFARIGKSRSLKVKSDKSIFAGEAITSPSILQSLVYHPDSYTARLILILGGVALAYDLLMVPFLLCFQIDETQGWINVMSWTLTSFWTFDMLISSMTGYYEHVVLEMRPWQVLRHYFRTWGILDLVINTSDWTSILLGTFSEKNGSASAVLSAGRALKYYRFLRILRMFRLFKLVQKMSSYIDGFATEVTLVFIRLLGIIMIIVLVSHYIACIWCAIAYGSAEDENTWMTNITGKPVSELLTRENIMHVYVLAIHWSITQFTPATNNINPANVRERVYAVFVVFFALVMFSSFLGSLASAITQLKKIHIERYQEEEQIRKFIFERQVSLNVARRIWNFYRTIYKLPSTTLCHNDIAFLQKLPAMLRISLHEDISMPIVCRHKAIGFLDHVDHKMMCLVCDRALSESGVRHGHEIFNIGSCASHMIFLNSGSVQYDCDAYPALETLNAPEIISEVAMWCLWNHQGHLNTTSQCTICKLDVDIFAKLVRDHLRPDVIRCVRSYAQRFVELINNNLFVTDIVHHSIADEFRASIDTIIFEVFTPLAPSPGRLSKASSASELGESPSLRERVWQMAGSLSMTSRRTAKTNAGWPDWGWRRPR